MTDANTENPLYSRLLLSQPPVTGNSRVVFPSTLPARTPGATAPTPVTAAPSAVTNRQALATTLPATVSTRSAQPLDSTPVTGPTGLPSQVVFSNFFHPQVCSFIKTLNRYGFPNLLALVTQQLTNDGGVISGFTLSPSSSATPGLTAGILYAQGELYAPVAAPNPGPAPANAYSWLFYTSLPPSSPGFYYGPIATFSQPSNPGDAVIGMVSTDASGAVITALSPIYDPTMCVFYEVYQPNTSLVDDDDFPQENIDFSFAGAYSIYNWELFFHIPLLVATQLSQNQQFQDAQTWFHYIFNPTISSNDQIPQRFWQCLPFYECSPWDEVEGQIENLFSSSPPNIPSPCGQDTQNQILAWQANPFDPFLIGRMRTIAFRMKVVMAYLDNLIAWGDSLFAQNTRESINEATQIYVLAKDILGPRPVQIPQRGTIQDYTYNDLITLFGLNASTPLGAFSNVLVQMENDFPYLTVASAPGRGRARSRTQHVQLGYVLLLPTQRHAYGLLGHGR